MASCCGCDNDDGRVQNRYASEEANHNTQYSESEALRFDPTFKGPLGKRSCTDVLCLLLFVAFIGAWGVVGWYAITRGDIDRLLVPTNTEGLKCGVDSEVKDEPYLLFFNLAKCVDPTVAITGCPTRQVCVKECPTKLFVWNVQTCNTGNIAATKENLICARTFPKSSLTTCSDIDTAINEDLCAGFYLKSTDLSRRCIPLVDGIESILAELNGIFGDASDLLKAISNIEILATINGMGQMIVEDIVSCWWQILLGLVASMLVCLIFIAIMRWLAGPTIWFSIIGVIAMLSYGIYYSSAKYNELKSNPVESQTSGLTVESLVKLWLAKKDTWLYLLIILSVLLTIIVLIVIFLRKRIAVAIALVKEGSKAVSSITSTVFFPLFPFILQLLVISFAVIVALYLASVGEANYKIVRWDAAKCSCTDLAASYTENGVSCDPTIFNTYCHSTATRSFFRQIENNPCIETACHFDGITSKGVIGWLQGYNVVGFFWGLFFIAAFGEMVLAATFATWYWTFHKSNVPFFTLSTGMGRTIRYHLGTIAFGSLIVAICRIIRVILEYIDQKVKKYDNPVTRAIMCCMKCFFWCLEKFLRFLNKNAYIMCAIHGKNFCGSAKDAFNLLMRNFLRVVALDKVTEFLFFLSKILIAGCMAALSYLFFTSEYTTIELNYHLVPVFLIAFGTYMIATVFFGVYSMAVDTLFLCFLEDCERNDGSEEKPYFMSKQLMKILGKKNKLDRSDYSRR